jgi:hypothetical protein
VPLQARWGEFVRVTVAAPVVLRGAAFINANGVAQAPQSWSTDLNGNVVLESRFENLDPDQRFALSSERPIDITITGLEAPAGGSCEGAVFTVEQGVLMPSIDEHAWLAELERRGGPELAARREAARVEAEARRQAHYAEWASRHVEVSAEVLASQDVIRQAHYAAWDANRAGQVAGGAQVIANAPLSADAQVVGDAQVAAGAQVAGGGQLAGSTQSVSSTELAACPEQAPVARQSGGVAVAQSGTVSSGPVARVACGAGASGGAVGSIRTTSPEVSSTVVSSNATASNTAVSSPSEWSQPAEASLRANSEWSQPSDTQLRNGGWEQPYAPRLDAVVVNSESQVAVSTSTTTEVDASADVAVPVPVPQPVRRCAGNCGTVVGFEAALPAMFQLMVNVGTSMPVAAPRPSNEHAAVPLNR